MGEGGWGRARIFTPPPHLVFDLGTNFFLCSGQSSGAIEIKNWGHNFLYENTKLLLAKVMPALQARMPSPALTSGRFAHQELVFMHM